ncbi:MAG: lysozyme, partial [Cyanobium sp.]
MSITPEGLQLIRQWEGCRLAAYPDPANGADPWTIGYGHTGADVRPELQISQAQAEAWLLTDVAQAEASVDRLLQAVALRPRQRDALVSFCFNVGAGALEDSTLRRRLLAGEAAGPVMAEELPRWCKGPAGPIEGLQRRRAAELAHASEPSSSAATAELIRQWEGCRLAAYPDPASGADPWTIGYGHTGTDVRPGVQISQAQAETWLLTDAAQAEALVDRLLQGVALSARQRDALVSFCFNVGAGAVEGSTLRRRLLAG